MENKKVYTIEINGIKESTNAIEALNAKLNELDAKIKKLEESKVNVSANASTSTTSRDNASALSEEAAIQKEINKLKAEGTRLDAKIVAAQDEVYKRVQATKDLYKETLQDQKAMAAQERLAANAYSNTMAGMKQHLADLKSVINTTDLGESDAIKKMTQEANELATKLKEMEEAYGQFGRNVGNYKSAAEGFSKYKIEVGGVVREFNSAREAAKTLANELLNLPKGAAGAKELRDALQQVKSEIKDIEKSSQAMDELLDTMESFTAVGQITNGFSAFFGFDNDEIQRSIQKLVALQNVMQGLEKINKQLNTQEGIGKIIAKGNDSIDATNFKLKRLIVSMQGTGTVAKATAAGVNFLTAAAKALSKVGIVALISAAALAIEKIVGAISDWVKGDADLVDSTAALNSSIKKQNEELEENLRLIKERENARQITSAEARIEGEKAYAKALKESRDQFLKNEQTYMDNGIVQRGKTDTHLTNAYGDKGVTSFGGFDEEIKGIDDFVERFDYLMTRVQNGQDITNSYKDTVEDAKDELVHMSKVAGGDFYNAMVKLADGTEKGTKSLVEYIRHMDELTKGRYSQAIKLGIDQGYLDGQFKLAWERYEKLCTDVYKSPLQVQAELNLKISTTLDGLDPTRAIKRDIESWENLLKAGVDEAGNVLTIEQRANISRIIEEQKKGLDKRNSSLKSSMKKAQKTVQDAENELARLRIDQMKEGLNKTLKQLEEERRQKIAKIRADGVMVKELELETNNLYDKKILDAKEEWARKIQQVYDNMWDKIYSINHQNAQMNFETELRDLETQYTKLQNEATKMLDKNTASYSSVLGNLTSMTAGEIGLPEAFFDKQTLASAKEYIDMLQKIQILEGNIKETMSNPNYSSDGWLQTHVRFLQEAADTEKQKLNEWLEINNQTEESMEKLDVVKALREQNYSKTLLREYKLRIQNRKQYYDEIQKLSIEKLNKEYEIEKEKIDENKTDELRTSDNSQEVELQALKDRLKKGEITKEQYNELYLRLEQEYADKSLAIQDKYNSLASQKSLEHQRRVQEIVSNAYNSRIQEYRDFMSRLNQNSSSSMKVNAWGFPNLKKMKQEIQQEKQAYQQLAADILNEKHRLQASLDANEISFDNFQQAQRELNNLQSMVANGLEELKEKEANYKKALLSAFNMGIQAIGQTINTILSSLSEIQTNQYDEMIDEQEKYVDKYSDLLDKQKDKTQEYADAVKNIEDELSTARGDRRQQLIDSLNAEMAAQRASLAQEKKIEKEKEKAEHKKADLEYDQAVARKEMQEKQALINAAMAVSMAAVNNWPIPAIPMMALAAAAGAAQYAAVKSQHIPKPSYGDGGVILGKSHAQGGVKVLGGMAEVEGGEYITNKVTTSRNVELLEYINSRKKRINLDDLIEFYGAPVRKNIQTVRTKFADGGQIPTLRSDITINDRLINAMEDYSNRPVQVAVVDIIDRQAAVNNVKVLAGLDS